MYNPFSNIWKLEGVKSGLIWWIKCSVNMGTILFSEWGNSLTPLCSVYTLMSDVILTDNHRTNICNKAKNIMIY